ncbi:Jlp2p [Saccharomyces cerevisiae YJM1463]|nr:Jlp2p [Saccharomyces cerevisiae YJM1463]
MVYLYESKPTEYSTPYQIVMGKDKFENDLLIKWSYRELNYVWFHADKYSSGHVYLKLRPNEKTIDDIPQEVICDCLQLCKSESIQGNKMPQCTILITPWHNLRKNRYMNPGEVSFKSLRQCRKMECGARDNKILNRLAKTRVELFNNVEATLNEAKKTKNGDFFVNYIESNRSNLIEEEKLRKGAKKNQKKKNKQSKDEVTDDMQLEV